MIGKKKICSLCEENKELQDSHIIPSFVITWLKNSSATGFLRTADNPNERFQDYHEKLLCEDCEQHFGTWEGWFGGNIFHPYRKGETREFDCEDWLHKFILSISWRLIICQRFTFDELPDYGRTPVNDAKTTWHQILQRDSQDVIDPYSHYMILLDDLNLSTPNQDLPIGWDFYTNRAIDAGVLHAKQTFVYFKFPHIAFFSVVQPPNVPGIKTNEIKSSKKVRPTHRLSREWESFLIERSKLATGHEISERQSEKIKEKLDFDDEDAPTETFETFRDEMERKMLNHSVLEYLDQECPICATYHKRIDMLPRRPIHESKIDDLEDRFEFVQGVYLSDLPPDIAPDQTAYLSDMLPSNATLNQIAISLVLSKETKSYLLTFHPEEGWIVDNDFQHGDQEDAVDVGQWVYESTLTSYEKLLGSSEKT